VEAREVKPPTALASLENDIAEHSSSRTIVALGSDANGRPQRRFRLRPVQGEATAMLVHPCAKHRIPLREQAMTMRLSRRVTECRGEAIEPISEGADAQLLARRNSFDGRRDLDE
jgi:hypothetical protein